MSTPKQSLDLYVIHPIREGQRWREVDPRFTRVIEVLGLNHSGSEVLIATVTQSGAIGTRSAWVKAKRFNGKRGGYAYHLEDNEPGNKP